MQDTKQKITWEELVQIENEFNTFLFDGVPVGSLLAANFYQYWWLGFKKYNYYARIKNVLRILKYRYLVKRSKESFEWKESLNNKFVFALTSNSDRYTSFFTPLEKLININDCVFIGNKSNPEKIDGIKYLNVSTQNNSISKEWILSYKKYKSEFEEKLNSVALKHHLPQLFIDEQKIFFIHQTKCMVFFNSVFEKDKPKCILADHDRQALNSAIILSAQKYQIPTYTFIHGNTYPNAEGFYPVIADKIFCWGEKHQEQFIKLNTSPDHLIITGNTKITREIIGNNIEIRKRLGIDINKTIILLATNNIELYKRHQLVNGFINFIQGISNIHGIIRLHPIETKEDYKEVQLNKNISMLDSNELTFEESFAVSTIVVIHNSTYGLEALIKRIPVLVLDIIEEPLFLGDELIDEGKCPRIKSKEDMKRFISEIISNSEINIDMKINNETLVNKYCRSFGDDAAKNIVSFIDSKCENQKLIP